MGELDQSVSDLSGWSWEDNKLFELALAVIDEGNPDRWEAVASMIGIKSAEEVEKHYEVLLEDLNFIESGRLDHEFGELFDCARAVCWTEEDEELLTQMNIK